MAQSHLPVLTSATLLKIAAPCVVAVLYGAYLWQRIRAARKRAEKIVAESKPYNLSDALRTKRILVFGDSTAVGVGVNPAESVAGRLAEYLYANVENYAVSGATTRDMAEQMAKAFRGHYDLVVIQIGANDVMRRKSLNAAASALDDLVQFIHSKSDRIIVLTAGDIGHAPLFLWPLSWLVSYRTRLLRTKFMGVCAHQDVQYVDIYREPDIFQLDKNKYYLPDGLHLTGKGYEYWFEIIKTYLDKWPELSRHTAVTAEEDAIKIETSSS